MLHILETWHNTYIIGKTSKYTYKIDTEDKPAVALPLICVAWVERDKIEEEINKIQF